MSLPRVSARPKISSIELLEARIAPSVVGTITDSFQVVGQAAAPEVSIVGNHTATYTDADGDLVKIQVSRGTLDKSDFVLVANGLGADLRKINFSDDNGEFAGANITITAQRGTFNGNGFANIGFLDSTAADLGKVKIKGDLGRINAGLPGSSKPAVKSLTVQSMGALGLATQDVGGTLTSEFAGNVGTISTKSDLDGATLAATGSIGVVKVRGSVHGGQISAGTTLGAISVRGDIVGTEASKVLITAFGKSVAPSKETDLAIGSLSVGGSVEFLRVLAGFDRASVGKNADASIGSITVAGDFHASTVLAGSAVGADGFEGSTDDVKLASPARDSLAIISRIARISIGGQAFGTLAVGDSYGIVAENIGKLKVGGTTFRLERGARSPGDFFPIGATVPGPNGLPSDFSIGEIVF